MGMRILRIISIQILFASVCSVGLILSGCKKDAPEPITPSESLEAPTADFETDQTGLSIAFSYTGERGETFVWDFGDGATSTEASPTHVYDAYGLYSVELTVSNTGGTAKTSSDVAVEGDALVSIPELGFSNVNGVFYAINHQRVWSVYGEPALVKTGAAKAWCSGTIGYTDVGAVTFKQGDYTASLNRGADNAYTWLESPDEQTGFKKGVGPTWSIAGGGQHGSINGLSNVWPFPATKEVIAESAIDITTTSAVSHSGAINNADSVFISVYGPNGSLTRRLGGAENSTSFTPGELSTLGKGKGQVQIVAYKIYEQVLGTKSYMVMNVAASQMDVTVE